MPLTLRQGTVTAIASVLPELVRCEVDGEPCLSFPRLTGPVALGDAVIVNVQARALGLGSGGFDLLYANLSRGLGLGPPAGAHVMSLPYTPLQSAARTIEEHGIAAHSLDGLPVVCCGLHSQLAPVLAGAGTGVRAAYVQVAGGALPVSLSDAVRSLKARGRLEVAVAVAPCLDGDEQAVTLASALLWARSQAYDCVVCAIGPGIVGTGTPFGHGGLAVAGAVNTTTALGGQAVVAPRISHGDGRERHRGLSHHTRAALSLALVEPIVAWPRGLAPEGGIAGAREVDVDGWREACDGLVLDHMGRGPGEDPWFFAAAFAAGRLARDLCRPADRVGSDRRRARPPARS